MSNDMSYRRLLTLNLEEPDLESSSERTEKDMPPEPPPPPVVPPLPGCTILLIECVFAIDIYIAVSFETEDMWF